jgi:hypothetical protein
LGLAYLKPALEALFVKEINHHTWRHNYFFGDIACGSKS